MGGEPGVEKSWGDRVDANAVPRPFHGEIPREADDRALAGGVADRVERLRRRAGQSGDRRDVDDDAAAAAEHHGAAGGLRHQEAARDIGVEHAAPLFERHRHGRFGPADPGVVHEDVEPAESLDRGREGGLHLIGLRDVAGESQAVDVLRLELGLGRHEPLLASRGDRDGRSRFTQTLGDLQPQAARSARDERDLAGEIEELFDVHRPGGDIIRATGS